MLKIGEKSPIFCYKGYIFVALTIVVCYTSLMENIELIRQLIERVGLTHYGKSLRSKNKELLTWIMNETSHLPDETKLGERVYIVLNGIDDRTCQYGSTKLFNTLNKGYRFCAPDCRCRREEQSKKITEVERRMSPDQQRQRSDKRRGTFLQRYGVDNAMRIQSAKEKLEATNMARLGVRYPGASQKIRDQIKQNNQEKYGCHPSSLEVTKARMAATNIERHGTKSTMHIARAAFVEQTGVINPFLLPEYQDKATATRITKYGAKTPLENPTILAKMIADVEAKYGTKSVLLLPQNRASATAPSKIGTSWLNSIGVPVREHVIELGQTYVRVDGYDPAMNTVYLFHGDFWHGNPEKFPADGINAKNGKTFGELYEHTCAVEHLLQAAGYNLIVMWEKEWKKVRKR